jgi:hypothetical protein
MRPRNIVSTAAGIMALGLGCAGLVLVALMERYDPPDPAKMRAYRMSLFTEEQLIQIKARSIEESEEQKRSPDAIFDEHVMGNCLMAQSVREARQRRCLPPLDDRIWPRTWWRMRGSY